MDIYNQNLYGQSNIQYQTGIESLEPNTMSGAEFGTHEATNYQPTTTGNVTRLPTIYQTEQESTTTYYDPNQAFNQQYVYVQSGQSDQLYQFQQQGNDLSAFYQQQIIQPQQNIINQQDLINQQLFQNQQQVIQQQPQPISTQAKMVQQMAKQQNLNQNLQNTSNIRQPLSASRNPYFNQQFKGQNVDPLNNPPQIDDNIQDGPIIESDFQPNFQIANSIINQSQIPLDPNITNPQNQSNMRPLPQQSQQVNYNQGVMASGRNPNLRIQQYGQLSNDSHFVTSVDPGSRTVFINNMNPVEPNLEKKTSDNIQQVSQLSHKESGISHNSIEDNQEPNQNEIENEKELNNDLLNKNDSMNLQNTVKTVETNEVLASKMSNDIYENENPIDEKKPDLSNLDNLRDDSFPMEMNQNPLMQSVSENMAQLPTIGSIMKGTSEMLPPPTKKKYQ
jgi:hypothetical protein